MLETLKGINSPEDVKALSQEEMKVLAKEVRSFLIQSLSYTGGHLASNLGVVELTIALHYVFTTPNDKFVWDVGHQAYVHKLLTGRRKAFKTLRQINGLSGFPKRCESIHDAFETGHSSTSISAALGMAKARDLKGEDNSVVAIIGDGALTGGMAFEALNNAGRLKSNFIVILNDNEMSISKNVGGLGKYLNKLRSSQDYIKVKEDVEDVLHKVPVIGDHMVDAIKRTKEGVKSVVMQHTLFEQLGLTYLGPIDGHALPELIEILENAKEMRGPVLIHVKTKKGKGYSVAEQKPSHYHSVGKFCVATGEGAPKTGNGQTFSDAFGEAMVKLGEKNEKILAITAAMPEGTGLIPFAKSYPKRCFDVGIAEQHGVTFAAGLAMEGFRPVVAIYSSFLQRAYDQILHDVCLQKLPVIFGIDRAGLVGEDGATHQGLYDISFLSAMPNMTILSPKAPSEMYGALSYALRHVEGPIAIRYPRGSVEIESCYINNFESIGYKNLKSGNNIAILATGRMVVTALEVSKKLSEQGIEVAIIEAPSVCPLDYAAIDDVCENYSYLFTLEDGIITGGFGERVFAYLGSRNQQITGKAFGFANGIVSHGKVELLFNQEGLDSLSITEEILTVYKKESR